MHFFAVGLILASGGAWAGEKDYVLESVAVGDFDCSGTLDHVDLWSSPKTGDLSAVVTLSTPAADLPKPFSGSDGWSVAFSDGDKDGCDELEITIKSGEVYIVDSADHEALIKDVQVGGGDVQPDVHVYLGKPLSHPVAWLVGGLGEFCDWFDYCWLDDCYEECVAEGPLRSTACGTDETGRTIWCTEWGCTSWKQQCI